MIARVTLEIALRKEFDYLIPPELADQVDVGSRVQVPFGSRKVLGCVTGAGRGIGARPAQADPQGHRRADAGHAQGPQARALDRRLLLLRAGDGAQERPARGRAPGAGRLARTALCPRPAGHRRIAEAAQAPAGSLAHPRRTARAAAAANCWSWPRPRRRPSAAWKTGAWSPSPPQISERDPYAREHILPTPTAAAEPGPGQGAGSDHSGHGRRQGRPEGRRSRKPEFGRAETATPASPPHSPLHLPAPRRHRQRQDGGLSAGHRPRAGAGQRRDRARAGNLAHAADRRALQGAVQLRPAANAGGRAAQPSVRRRAARRMAQDPPGPRPHRHRRALGHLCAGRAARPHHRGRGTRAHLQAGGSAALPRARRGHRARPDGRRRGRARLGHAVAGELLQLRQGQIHAARTARARRRPEDARRAHRGHAPDRAAGQRASRSSRRSSRRRSPSGSNAASRRFCS